MIDYTWVDWLEALATMIAENGERYLAERARAVDWQKDDVPLLAYGDENIDPMSFLYFLAQRNTTHQFQGIFGSVHEVFDIALDFPESQPFMPAPPANAKALFHGNCSPGLGNRIKDSSIASRSARTRKARDGSVSAALTS